MAKIGSCGSIALEAAGVLADGAKSVAYSYTGTDLTWPIYRHGTLGRAKEDLDRASAAISAKPASHGGSAYVGVLKSVVTQASAAIPVMPLYISMSFQIMKQRPARRLPGADPASVLDPPLLRRADPDR